MKETKSVEGILSEHVRIDLNYRFHTHMKPV